MELVKTVCVTSLYLILIRFFTKFSFRCLHVGFKREVVQVVCISKLGILSKFNRKGNFFKKIRLSFLFFFSLPLPERTILG